uniref:Tetratricopeptide repeat-containing protein n=1 Tax=Candidatus Kentrum sp. TC TaxID=2126339 RepID=A0A451A3I7_9GAMM|nr:MAG: hypothetical protein BECKTC1821F_GA0114240_104712 [Candidatus Kentron sp. TC]
MAGECARVIERASETFGWAQAKGGKSGISLDRLTLGRAELYRALLAGGAPAGIAPRPSTEAADIIRGHLDAAVDGLRQMNRIAHLPDALLSRSWLRFLLGERAGAVADLDEALREARRLIGNHSYHRRDGELAGAEAANTEAVILA